MCTQDVVLGYYHAVPPGLHFEAGDRADKRVLHLGYYHAVPPGPHLEAGTELIRESFAWATITNYHAVRPGLHFEAGDHLIKESRQYRDG